LDLQLIAVSYRHVHFYSLNCGRKNGHGKRNLKLFIPTRRCRFSSDFLAFFAERLAASALTPFKPPSLPSATAAGFLAGAGDRTGAAYPVDCWTVLKVVSFKSQTERLGMAKPCAVFRKIQVQRGILDFKLYNYRFPATPAPAAPRRSCQRSRNRIYPAELARGAK
jgi:hypothetical protein